MRLFVAGAHARRQRCGVLVGMAALPGKVVTGSGHPRPALPFSPGPLDPWYLFFFLQFSLLLWKAARDRVVS